MGTRHPNHRLVKIHRNYTVDEVAVLFSMHRNTIRQWIKVGLPTIDARRPQLILGRELVAFLKERRALHKRPCSPGEIYCVRCRVPQSPAGNMADYQPLTGTSGNLVGICPRCEGMIFRRISLAKLEQIRAGLEVTIPEARGHIDESTEPSVNSDFRQVDSNHGNAPPR